MEELDAATARAVDAMVASRMQAMEQQMQVLMSEVKTLRLGAAANAEEQPSTGQPPPSSFAQSKTLRGVQSPLARQRRLKEASSAAGGGSPRRPQQPRFQRLRPMKGTRSRRKRSSRRAPLSPDKNLPRVAALGDRKLYTKQACKARKADYHHEARQVRSAKVRIRPWEGGTARRRPVPPPSQRRRIHTHPIPNVSLGLFLTPHPHPPVRTPPDTPQR